ncbi:hypothetical protein FB567DRAFT_558400 [Paraphoma chrysanthemicola]|uniref:SET domain-containing protein n=1 Tax=Paraphoma chrysanthemicola TaxID=798071 RepID=A0A8K0REH6_9PLEO|nr:hypothetical protein FB567DRAFT_558400 [Paraphoma chrysanthemicola]
MRLALSPAAYALARKQSRVTERGGQQCYEVRAIPGKGQGLVAIRDLFRGTRILSERPLFTVPRDTRSLQVAKKAVLRNLKSLSDEQRKAFYRLHNAHGDDEDSALGIARTNTLPLGAGSDTGGLFLQASRINHACNSNAQNTWNSNTEQLNIHACRDITKDEEICISYLDGWDNYASRQRNLKNHFGFTCTCTLCSLPLAQREQSDLRSEEMTRLDSIVGDGRSIVIAPLACLYHVQTMIQFMAEEHIDDARIPRTYYDALQIAIAHGDQARAKVFAERAYSNRRVLEGDDSPETKRVKEFMERPSSHRLYGTTMKWRQGVDKIPKDKSAEEFESWLWRRSK